MQQNSQFAGPLFPILTGFWRQHRDFADVATSRSSLEGMSAGTWQQVSGAGKSQEVAMWKVVVYRPLPSLENAA